MKNLSVLIVFVVFIMLCFGCAQKNQAEDIINIDTEIAVVGLKRGALLINESRKEDVQNLDELSSAGVQLSFDTEGILRQAVIESSKYQTRKGVQVGDDADAVRQQYGKPQNRRLSLNKSRRSIGEMKGLFYKDIFFVMDGENKVIAIILGNTKA
ncbi:MAG TPA: hypothetical protein PLU64_15885 [Saprospiraceae bacterium]|nr:hypothetical protein [Alphaproteobacteria bacterium]MCB9303091.1 hypothetical protein [Lewinellaceae bacterium]HQU60687.1 hypothetical protein [Saprospiraceae bacterium]